MLDIGVIAKLLKNPSDLPSAAKALGMDHKTIAPGEGEVRTALLRVAFQRLADAAQQQGSEVIELAGAPSMLKGKRVRILAVLEDVQEKSFVRDGDSCKVEAEELQPGVHYKAISS
jgi:hypothetical protein